MLSQSSSDDWFFNVVYCTCLDRGHCLGEVLTLAQYDYWQVIMSISNVADSCFSIAIILCCRNNEAARRLGVQLTF